MPQRYRTVWNERVVLDLRRTNEFGRSLLRLFLVDHQFVEGKNIVLIANGAAIIGVYEYNHDLFPL